MNTTIWFQPIEHFARQTYAIPDTALDRFWAWKSYDSEGIRFAFFRTYEELRELAVHLRRQRVPLSQAQMILASYQTAYWDLQAALLGIENGLETQSTADGEWSVRQVLAHIIGAEVGFYVVIRYALDGLRLHDGRPERISQEAFAATCGVDEASFMTVMKGPWENMQSFYHTLHERVLREFADVTDEELEAQSTYWEAEPMSLRFRLHRIDSHLRQHTIHIDKILVGIGQSPNETKSLLRLIYSALADVESVLIGSSDIGRGARLELAETICSRGEEITSIAAG